MPPRRINLSEVGRQNIVYSDAEQIVIKNGLKRSEAGLLRLGTLRSDGAGRRRQLKDQIYRCQAALAPFKRIPKEIWIYIFKLYCQSGRLSTCHAKRQPPVVITQVCSAWRQIALSMPKLWSDVLVHLGKNINLARMWLGRAGKIPRALETSALWSLSHCSSSSPIQGFVCSFPFRKLHITQCDAARIDFTKIPVKSLLLLEDLALLKPDSPYLEATSLSYHHFPNLVSLNIDTNMTPLFHAYRPFSTLKKLRVLQLEYVLNKTQCLEILHDASSLEDCSFHLRLAYGQDLTIESVVFANMKILRLSFTYTSSLWPFMDHLTFPNLHTLILISRNSIINFRSCDKPPLLHLMPRVASLISLKIHQFYMDVDVDFVLECLPLLQVLKLHCKRITTDAVEKIGRGELGGCLRELHDWNHCNLFKLLQACELRRDVTQGQSPNSSGAIARLEKVSVRHFRSITDCKLRIRKLRNDGIEFKVQKHPAITSTSSGCTCC